jgi:hypothetical protein
MKPSQCPAIHNPDCANRRRLHCTHYNQCLNFAVHMDWESFDCIECPDYEQMTADDERRDLYAIAEMVSRIPAEVDND